MKTRDRKRITSYTLTDDTLDRIETLHNQTLLTRSKIIELLVFYTDKKKIKRLVNLKTKEFNEGANTKIGAKIHSGKNRYAGTGIGLL